MNVVQLQNAVANVQQKAQTHREATARYEQALVEVDTARDVMWAADGELAAARRELVALVESGKVAI